MAIIFDAEKTFFKQLDVRDVTCVFCADDACVLGF